MEYTTCKELFKMRVVDLKKMAKSRGLRGYYKMCKDELIYFLKFPPEIDLKKEEKLRGIVKAEIIEEIKEKLLSHANYYLMEEFRVIDLKDIAKSIGLRGYSKLRKAELIDLLKQSDPFSRR